MSRRVLGVKVPEDVQLLIDALPNKSEWLRRVIVTAANQELRPDAIAPHTTEDCSNRIAKNAR